MKTLIFAFVLLFFVTGCQATKSVVTEYDSEGRVIKVTETGESVVKNITDSTKNKTVICWESGWAAYISGSTATQEDPTPTIKMFAGKTDKGAISALPTQQDWNGIANVINATKYELSVSTTGISSKSSGAIAVDSEEKKQESSETAK